MASTSARKIIDIAKAELGYHEGRSPDGDWNNRQKYSPAVPGLEWSQGQAWCATFVSWLALKAGHAGLYPRTASCDQAGAWFKSRRRWSEYPAVGAQVFYGTPSDLNHTGLVIAFDADTITTIEGNTNTIGSRQGDGVYQLVHQRRSPRIVGYGYPAFPEGIDSADPAWAHSRPAAPKPATKPPAKVPPKPARRKTRGQVVDQMIATGQQAAKNNANHPGRLARIRAALAELRKIKEH